MKGLSSWNNHRAEVIVPIAQLGGQRVRYDLREQGT